MKSISILGCTGSIGRNSLKVVEHLAENFRVVGLAAGSNIALLAEQVARFRPELVSVSHPSSIEILNHKLDLLGVKPKPKIFAGTEGLLKVAIHPEVDLLVSAVVGVAGLVPTYEAIQRGKSIALANKEILVVAGALVTKAASARGVTILPVDSEHNAIHQCLRVGKKSEVHRVILTASGGPFRTMPLEKMEFITPQMALNHPTWKMGSRITIDSATLMKKGFEVIEAQWLFGLPVEKVAVLIHPQSIVHSLVEYIDGAVIAHLGVTDMRHPIQYALTYPDRVPSSLHPLDFTRLQQLEFMEPDLEKFPCLDLAYQAARKQGLFPCFLNAADEIAVDAFLKGKIPFTAIPPIINRMLKSCPATDANGPTLEEILEQDTLVRIEMKKIIELDYSH
jgi:1-deoxy-D-xylulose-5-phosphate reductoisomerase